jgi:flagellar hook-associated protein 1 FlgK
MSKNPSDDSYRKPVRENALAFTKHINETAIRLENMMKETEKSMDIKVKNINNLTAQIGNLNRQIYSAEINGQHANDLRDRRELLVDELSKIVNVRVDESPEGKYTVSVSGISIVEHITVNKVKFDKNSEEKIFWENGSPVKLKSGELKGLIDLYNGDGKNNNYRGIPYYINKLNDFAKGFATKFNEQHREGYGLDGTTNGIDFFKFDSDNPAATITLDNKIMEDLKNIAAASKSPGDDEDNENLLALIKLREDKEFFTGDDSQGTPDDFIKSILSSLAVDSLQSKRIYGTQELIQQNAELKRKSISGVSEEEEMADMVRFQHVYVASARMITTMDTIIETTINRLGLVGR